MKKKLKCFVCHKEVNEEDDYVFKGQTVHKGECLKSMIDEYNAVRNLQIRNKRLCAEIERLNNIINDLLKRQNEALNYISNFLSMDNRYKHGNGNDELELVRRILNKHNQEPKGSDSNE